MPELAKRSDMLATKQDLKEVLDRVTFIHIRQIALSAVIEKLTVRHDHDQTQGDEREVSVGTHVSLLSVAWKPLDRSYPVACCGKPGV